MKCGAPSYEDVIGTTTRPAGRLLSQLDLPLPLAEALIVQMRGDLVLTPPQEQAIQQGVLTDSAHYLVSAPTKSGKTLIALLRIFGRSLRSGGRYVYVAPLKALAEQKVTELREIAAKIVDLGGKKIEVRISTGDYRISEDFMDSVPDESAGILVCTPERLEVLLRNPENRSWAMSVDTFVLDEFHILGQANRGARYETMVTQLLLSCPESNFLALSATIGSPENVSLWLAQGNHPLRVINSRFRAPRLRRQLVVTNEKDAWIEKRATEVLAEANRSLLVFVYRKNDAVRLAKRIQSNCVQVGSVRAFHSAMPLHIKASTLRDFQVGNTRVLVCTTSLAMGINSPATDVIVRDTVFYGFGKLQVSDILQMTGRAGRGGTEGTSVVLFSDTESWQSLATSLEGGEVEPLLPQLIPSHAKPRRKREPSTEHPNALTTAMLTVIGGKQSVRLIELHTFVSHTYSATCHGVSGNDIHEAVRTLIEEKLIYRVENSEDEVAATKLGRTVNHAGLSAESGALMGSFLRSMISLSEKEGLREAGESSYLRRLKPIDYLVICLAAYEARGFVTSASYKVDRNCVEAYIEGLDPDDKPLTNLWRDPDSSAYPTRRLLSTLRLAEQSNGDVYWKLMSMALTLHDYSTSRRSVGEICEKWGLKVDLEGRLVPLVSWLLNAMTKVCSGAKCYKLDFMLPEMRTLLLNLSVGGGFGKLLDLPGVGLATVDKIRNSGLTEISQLANLSHEELVTIGIGRSSASAITRMMSRRSR